MLFVGSKRFVLLFVATFALSAPTIGAFSASVAQAAPAEAARGVYVIPDHEGYGILECVTQKKDCGRVVADAWCEAHGHGPALAFGGAADVTFATGSAPNVSPGAQAAVVACAE